MCKAGQDPSPETSPASTSILDLQPPELQKTDFCVFKPVLGPAEDSTADLEFVSGLRQ